MANDDPDDLQLRSWSPNADAWTAAVREARIPSRVEVTNAAICRAVLDLEPTTALDLGCGEGWLVRELLRAGVDARGVDGSPELVARARELGSPDRYAVASYEALERDPAAHGKFDVVIANFSLLGERSTEQALRATRGLLGDNGHLVIQTAHPFAVADPTRSGWREGSWKAFGDDFTVAAPWFFRTVADWVVLLTDTGLALSALDEPRDAARVPASLLVIARLP